ncbi:hypothetical protein K438DRAFT_1551876, partial [Mycena galopus ATCC 62051]
IPVAKCEVMLQSIDAMIRVLDAAVVQSADLPSAPAISVTHLAQTGQHGRPHIKVDYDFLFFRLELHGPVGLAPVAGVSSCTICFHALEYELVEPAPPVYTETVDEASGEVICMYTSSTSGPVSDISYRELNELMHHILEIFPAFGRRMIAGHLQ